MRRAAFIVMLVLAGCAGNEEPKVSPNEPTYKVEAPPELAGLTVESMAKMEAKSETGESCDQSLWKHVYHGTYDTPKERLVPMKLCTTVTGTIMHAVKEKDGDWHIRLKLDPQYSSMLNARNKNGQHGHLVVEPMCANKVSQNDTKTEKVCDGFNQDLYDPKTMLNKHVVVTGSFVTDVEGGHGWNEIHPVSKIVVTPQ